MLFEFNFFMYILYNIYIFVMSLVHYWDRKANNLRSIVSGQGGRKAHPELDIPPLGNVPSCPPAAVSCLLLGTSRAAPAPPASAQSTGAPPVAALWARTGLPARWEHGARRALRRPFQPLLSPPQAQGLPRGACLTSGGGTASRASLGGERPTGNKGTRLSIIKGALYLH